MVLVVLFGGLVVITISQDFTVVFEADMIKGA